MPERVRHFTSDIRLGPPVNETVQLLIGTNVLKQISPPAEVSINMQGTTEVHHAHLRTTRTSYPPSGDKGRFPNVLVPALQDGKQYQVLYEITCTEVESNETGLES
jgi:hypothetical protein